MQNSEKQFQFQNSSWEIELLVGLFSEDLKNIAIYIATRVLQKTQLDRNQNWMEQPLEIGLFQKKSKRGVGYFFENSPWNFSLFYCVPQGFPEKTKLNPWIFHKIVLDPLEIPRPKLKTPGNSTAHYFFFVALLGNSTSFLTVKLTPGKFHMLFL